jgi:hypothetical protein
MATFRVGMRIRMARPCNPANLGKTGTIAEIYPIPKPAVGGPINCAVDWDDGSRGARFHEPVGEATHTDQLEPILDQKHEACDEDFKRDMDELLERQGVAA